MEKAVAILCVGATVDFDDQRILLLWIEALRFEDPGIHRPAVCTSIGHILRRGKRQFAEQGIVEARHTMQLTRRCCRAYKDLLCPCCTRNEHGQLTSRRVSTEVAHMHITWRKCRWLGSCTSGRNSVDARSTVLRGEYIERFAIGRPGRGRHEMFIAHVAIRPV